MKLFQSLVCGAVVGAVIAIVSPPAVSAAAPTGVAALHTAAVQHIRHTRHHRAHYTYRCVTRTVRPRRAEGAGPAALPVPPERHPRHRATVPQGLHSSERHASSRGGRHDALAVPLTLARLAAAVRQVETLQNRHPKASEQRLLQPRGPPCARFGCRSASFLPFLIPASLRSPAPLAVRASAQPLNLFASMAAAVVCARPVRSSLDLVSAEHMLHRSHDRRLEGAAACTFLPSAGGFL